MVTHTGWGLVLVGQPRPTPRERGPALTKFGGFLQVMRTPFDAELTNMTWQHIGTVLFLGTATPTPNGRGPALPNIWGFPYIYAYTLCRKTTNFDMATHMKRGNVFRRSTTAPSERGGAPELPNFCGSPLSMTTLFKEEQQNWAW